MLTVKCLRNLHHWRDLRLDAFPDPALFDISVGIHAVAMDRLPIHNFGVDSLRSHQGSIAEDANQLVGIVE